MKSVQKLTTCAVAIAIAGAMATPAQADVNVAFFLEWATPNQIAKVEKTYDDALGETVNWTNFDAGTQMTEAMLAGDIDISFSQGLAPFILAVNAGAPIKMVALAVQYPANDCVVKTGAGIDSSNANELEGKDVAVPLGTMADYSFRMQMRSLGVDVSKVNVIDQVPADAAVSLTDGAVTMACGFGGDSMAKMYEAGTSLMSGDEKEAAGITSFDVVSVTEKFMQENPEALRTFLQVTDEANTAFASDQSKLGVIAADAGMDEDRTAAQMATMSFPSNADQLSELFTSGGFVDTAIGIVGNAFATEERPALSDYSAVIDTSFLK